MKALKSFILFTLLLQVEVFAQTQYKWENPCNQTFQVVKGQAFCNELKGTYARLPDMLKTKYVNRFGICLAKVQVYPSVSIQMLRKSRFVIKSMEVYLCPTCPAPVFQVLTYMHRI